MKVIWSAPTLPGGERIAEATSAVTPWPHQLRAFQRMLDHWPPRLLIADEMGLGKTIEAGMLLRYAWLSRRARRILILAPKAVMTQWQIELREKFNLNWPIYDGKTLNWYPSPLMRGHTEREVSREEWHREPFVIASSHLMRRRDRQAELCETAEPWDLVVLDEAHHARRKSPGASREGPPNLLLQLMQKLRERTQSLLLLTATPMQVHPVEVWDLLSLLAMPGEWSRSAFLEFFRLSGNPNPSHQDFERLAQLYRAAESAFGPIDADAAIRRTSGHSRLRAQKILRALRDHASTPRRQLSADERRSAVSIMRAHTPVAGLVSRHTRDLLREYHRRGLISTLIASREVVDEFLDMTPAEEDAYRALEDYISSTYNKASEDKRSAVGFVMTTYRKRLASSFYALRRTLKKRLAFVSGRPACRSTNCVRRRMPMPPRMTMTMPVLRTMRPTTNGSPRRSRWPCNCKKLAPSRRCWRVFAACRAIPRPGVWPRCCAPCSRAVITPWMTPCCRPSPRPSCLRNTPTRWITCATC